MAKLGIVSLSATEAGGLRALDQRSGRGQAVTLDPSYRGDTKEFEMLVIDGACFRAQCDFISRLLRRSGRSVPLVVTSISSVHADEWSLLDGRRVWLFTGRLDRAMIERIVTRTCRVGGCPREDYEAVDEPVPEPEWQAMSRRQLRSCRQVARRLEVVASQPSVEQRRDVARLALVGFVSNVSSNTRLILLAAGCLRRIGRGGQCELGYLLRQFLSALCDAVDDGPVRREKRVLAALNQVHAGQLRQRVIAHELGIDPSHLGHLIRRTTGFSFCEWSVAARIAKILEVLASTTAPVKQIAYDAGCGTSANFDRCFRRLFGMSPTEFRKYYESAAARRGRWAGKIDQKT